MATIMRKMNVISRCESMYRAKHSSINLPGIYHSYIFAICNTPGYSQDKLAKHVSVSKSSATRHLTFLEENGYIERKISEQDKRETLVYPTQKMLDLLPEIRQITREWNKKVLVDITDEEVEILNGILDKVLERATDTVYGKEVKK